VFKGKNAKESPKKDPTKFKTHGQRKRRSRLLCAQKDFCFGDVVPPHHWSIEVLFANPEDAKLMSWHASNEHNNDGKLRHPADGKQWQWFNENHRDFANESRNVRFTLSTDGMNPFDERSSKHSTWPVILSIYILPPQLMQKQKYILLTILIFGPTQPRVDLDGIFEALNGGYENIMGNKCSNVGRVS
jgi:hypothetical protein